MCSNEKKEGYEQEIYKLKSQVDLVKKTVQHLNEENELEKQKCDHLESLSCEQKKNIKILEEKHAKFLEDKQCMKEELKLLQQSNKELDARIKEEEKNTMFIKNERGSVKILENEEMCQLVEENNRLKGEIAKHAIEIETLQKEKKYIKQTSECTVQLYEQKLSEKVTEIDGIKRELYSVHHSLQCKSAEVDELKMELEEEKFNQFDPNLKGNSIFFELEDNRRKMEQQLITLKGRYRILKRKNQLQETKNRQLLLENQRLLRSSEEENSLKEYCCTLEDAIKKRDREIKMEIEENLKLKKKRLEIPIACSECNSDIISKPNVPKYFYEEQKLKISTHNDEIMKVKFGKVVLEDELRTIKRKMIALTEELDKKKSENFELINFVDDIKNDPQLIQKLTETVDRTLIKNAECNNLSETNKSTNGNVASNLEPITTNLQNDSSNDSVLFKHDLLHVSANELLLKYRHFITDSLKKKEEEFERQNQEEKATETNLEGKATKENLKEKTNCVDLKKTVKFAQTDETIEEWRKNENKEADKKGEKENGNNDEEPGPKKQKISQHPVIKQKNDAPDGECKVQ